MKMRVLAFALAILAFFIFVGSPFQHTTKAIVVDASLIGIIIAALAAMGITITAAGSFGDVTEYVEGLLEEYAQSRGLTVNQLFDGVQTGSNKLGDILLNNRFVILIDTFAKWIVNKFALTDNDSQALVTPGASINNLTLYKLPIVLDSSGGGVKDKGIQVLSSQDDVFVVFGENSNGSTLYANAVSNAAATIQLADVSAGGTWTITNTQEMQFNETYQLYYRNNLYTYRYFRNNPYLVYQQASVVEALTDHGIQATGKQIDVTTGVISYPTDDPDYTATSGAILDVGGSWGETYDNLTDYQIPAGYQDSTIEYQGEAEVADQVEDTPAQTVSQNVSDYQVNGLSGVFPFCIPFDLYNFVGCLAADPVAPSFTWRFYVPGICDESIEIDLSEFDTAAQILRTMELLLFCVGLAFVTRKIIRG